MEITLVRHTKVNVHSGICYGQADVGLSETFYAEALQIAGQLMGHTFDAVFTSPLNRCTRLAYQLGYHNAIRDDRLIELNFGDWELKPWENITGEYAERWMEDYLNLPCPGGESLQDLVGRVADFYRTINKKFNKVLVFSHSGPIRVFHHLVRPTDYHLDKLFEWKIDFGSVFVIKNTI